MAESTIKISIPDEIRAELSQMTADEILQVISEASSERLNKDIQITWKQLQRQAKIFLSAITSLDTEYNTFTATQLKNVVANPDIASYVNNSQRKKEVYYVQSLYMLAAQFEDYLSIFRQEDKERSMLYVFTNKDNSNIETYEMSFRELIINADSHGRLGNLAKKRLTDRERINIEGQGIFNEDHIKTAKSAYQGAFNRWSRYFEVHSSSQKQNGFILWKEGRRWMIGNLINTGDLKEAYAAFLFEDHEKDLLCGLNKGTAPYYSHELIGEFYKNYINKVTNLEAIIEEDILTTDKQYGIKGKKAQLPSLQQYIDVANIILLETNVLTKEELEKKINDKFKVGDSTKGARNIYKLLTDAIAVGDVIEQEMRKIIK